MSSSDRGVGLDLDAIEARKLATLNALIVAGRALGDQASITQGCVTSDVWATKQALRDLKNDRDALVAEVRRLREFLSTEASTLRAYHVGINAIENPVDPAHLADVIDAAIGGSS